MRRPGPMAILRNPDELNRLARRVERHVPGRITIAIPFTVRLAAHWRIYRRDYALILWALFLYILFLQVTYP